MAENPTPTPGEPQRSVGSGEQQAYGEATAQNESMALGDAVEEQLLSQQVVQEPEMAVPLPEVEYADDMEDPTYEPQDDMEQVLFGDPEGFESTKEDAKNRPVPNSVIRALPGLAAVVRDPSTPAAIRAAYNIILQRLEAELKANH